MNRYVRDTGVANLPAPCRGAAWVRPMTDPASPFYCDQSTRLRAKHEWNRLPFERGEIEERAISGITLEE